MSISSTVSWALGCCFRCRSCRIRRDPSRSPGYRTSCSLDSKPWVLGLGRFSQKLAGSQGFGPLHMRTFPPWPSNRPPQGRSCPSCHPMGKRSWGAVAPLTCPVAMEKKGILFWLVDFQGELLPAKKGKRAPLGNWAHHELRRGSSANLSSSLRFSALSLARPLQQPAIF